PSLPAPARCAPPPAPPGQRPLACDPNDTTAVPTRLRCRAGGVPFRLLGKEGAESLGMGEILPEGADILLRKSRPGTGPAAPLTDETADLTLAFLGRLLSPSSAPQTPENAKPCCRLQTTPRPTRGRARLPSVRLDRARRARRKTMSKNIYVGNLPFQTTS